jgi:hypothetical protein
MQKLVCALWRDKKIQFYNPQGIAGLKYVFQASEHNTIILEAV